MSNAEKPRVYYVGICGTTRAWHISEELRTGADHIFVNKSDYDALAAHLAEAKQLIEADNRYLKRLERALAYAKQTWDEHPAKSVWDAAVERLERGE